MNDKQCDAIDVLKSIDQLRRDLSGYHDQLKAHNDLQRHCDRQREQLAALGAAHKPIKAERDAYKRQAERLAAENAKLRELVTELAHTTVKCQNGECKDCQFGNPTGFGCRWDAHMRELGVEVDA